MSGRAVGWAFEQRDLTPVQKLVLVALAENANSDGIAWPSKQELIVKTGLSQATVYRALAILQDRGLFREDVDEKGRERFLLPQVSHTEKTDSHSENGFSHTENRTISKEPSKNRVGEPERADAPLSFLLADLIEQNGSKRPTVGKKWADADRLMLERDGRPFAEAESLIRWCQDDEFWRANILSMAKFRQQYDRLRLQRERSGRAPMSPDDQVDHDLRALEAAAQAEQARWADETT